MWVQQELVLATDLRLVYGDAEIDWASFFIGFRFGIALSKRVSGVGRKKC
jgi:hypothetical protein